METAVTELDKSSAVLQEPVGQLPLSHQVPTAYYACLAKAVSPAHAGALRMAAMGIPVFPLHGIVDDKCTCGKPPVAPHCSPGRHPHHFGSMHTPTIDPAVINQWFKDDPRLNYAVRTGVEIRDSGKMVVVVDVNSYKYGGADALHALEAVHGRLPDTAEVLTGAGGSHRYYLADCSHTFAGTMGSNIDLKVNGYVVGPSSVHASGRRYEWEASSDLFEGHPMADLPGWVHEEFGKHTKAPAPNYVPAPTSAPLHHKELASIKHYPQWITAACSRDEWLKVLMALHSRSQCAQMFAVADTWSQTSPEQYEADSVVAAWNSFTPNGGITIDYIVALARIEIEKSVDLTKLLAKLACTPAQPEDDNDTAAASELKSAAVQVRYNLQSAHELANTPPLQWMIRCLFPMTGLTALYGPSGSGKSFLALDLAVAVAGGANEWYGMRVTNRPVIYCVLEGEGSMGKRVKAWQQHHDKPLPVALRFVTQPINLLRPDDVRNLADAIRQAGGNGGLVVLDTLNRAAPEADENSSKDMGAIIAGAKALRAAIGGLIMLVHHTGKQLGAGMRGHSSLFAAMDAVIGVVQSDAGPRWEI